MEIKAADVKALRDRTGAGMMDCKKALVECNGNQDEAEKYLKEKAHRFSQTQPWQQHTHPRQTAHCPC